MNKRLFAAVFIVALVCPLVSNAATQEELQAQIADLLNRINALQVQLGATGAPQTVVPPVGVNPAQVQCPLISRSLKRGSSGEDVTRLQRFLALDPTVYPEAQVTGYYGALTEAAVQRFQCKNKLVCQGSPSETGYGVTGPRTAALLALQCPDLAGNVSGFIKATPVSGNAPLPVVIEVTLNTLKSCSGGTYEVDFGDNTPKASLSIPPNNCNEVRQTLNHTYAYSGTFPVTLRSGIHQTSVTVTVGGGIGAPPPITGNTDSVNASPRSGGVPLNVTFSGLMNAAGACNSGTYTLQFGDGQSVTLTPSGCSSTGFNVTHQYTAGGNYVAWLIRNGNGTDVGSVSISVGGSSSGDSISASPTSGSAPLNVTFTGTINYGGACNSPTYTINFGDGSTMTLSQSGCNSTGYNVAHTYNTNGTYTARLQRGGSDVSSQTITVGSGGSGGTQYGSYFAVTPGVDGDVFTVVAEFELVSSCTAYQLNWGDGSSPASQSQGSCGTGTVRKELHHTYDDTGSFTITLKRGPTLNETQTAGVAITD